MGSETDNLKNLRSANYPNLNPDKIIQWKTLEYEHFDHHSDWFWLVGFVGFVVTLTAVITLNFLFAVVAVIATFSVMMYGTRRPESITVTLSRRGVKLGENFYPYKNISAFALRDDEEPHKLIIYINRLFLPHVSIYLENTDPELVRQHLMRFLTEEPYNEPFLETIASRLGF